MEASMAMANFSDIMMQMAVPTEAVPAVLWVFRDIHGNWCAREEGGATTGFATREAAVEFAQRLGRAWGAYRLFLELKDGRFTQELLNLRSR
jgi:hypothetical protein